MFPWNWFDKNFQLDENALQNLIEQWTKQMWPHNFQAKSGNQTNERSDHLPEERPSLQEEVFETHDYIFIRIPIRSRHNVKNIKIQFSHNKCTLTGLLENNEPYVLLLPSPVQKKGARAVYRDEVLEIQLVKSFDWHMSEIDIDEL